MNILEALPGGVDLFARAYQQQIGGNLTGSAAIKALNEAMKKGQVRGSVLVNAASLASQQASPTLGLAGEASQAQQARYQNALNDQAITASNAGVEAGFARLFRTLATGLNESTGLVRNLAEAFDSSTVQLEKILLFPQSFTRALEGRDSLVSEWLGVGKVEQLREDWTYIKQLFDDIMGMQTPTWLPSLESTTKEIAALLGQIARFQQWRNESSQSARQIIEDDYDGSVLSNLKGIARANLHTFSSLFSDGDPNAQYWADRDPSGSFSSTDEWRDFTQQRDQQTARDVFGRQGYGINQPVQQSNTNTFNIEVALQTDNTADFDNYFRNQFQQSLGQLAAETRIQFPEVE